MGTNRRYGAADSAMRSRFVAATEALLAEEGSHALSARHVAARAGLKTQLLFYYFPTIDDLLRAVARAVHARRLERFEAALAAPDPLRALWMGMSDPSAAALASELSALALHRPALREEIVAAAQDARRRQMAALAAMPGAAVGDPAIPPAALAMLAAALARFLVTEEALGFTDGHAEVRQLVEAFLDRAAAAAAQGADKED